MTSPYQDYPTDSNPSASLEVDPEVRQRLLPRVLITSSAHGEWIGVHETAQGHSSIQASKKEVFFWAATFDCPITVLVSDT